jgi:hypothetical protein
VIDASFAEAILPGARGLPAYAARSRGRKRLTITLYRVPVGPRTSKSPAYALKLPSSVAGAASLIAHGEAIVKFWARLNLGHAESSGNAWRWLPTRVCDSNTHFRRNS